MTSEGASELLLFFVLQLEINVTLVAISLTVANKDTGPSNTIGFGGVASTRWFLRAESFIDTACHAPDN